MIQISREPLPFFVEVYIGNVKLYEGKQLFQIWPVDGALTIQLLLILGTKIYIEFGKTFPKTTYFLDSLILSDLI